MNDDRRLLLALLLLAGAGVHTADCCLSPEKEKVAPAPARPVGPVCPPDGPCPPVPEPVKPKPKPRSPWGEKQAPVGAQASVGGPKNADGTELDCDLPEVYHRKNTSSRGQGCCVFTSIHHASIWQNVPELREFPKWLQSKGLTGGGYSGNVKERITAICKERGVPEPAYLQVENGDIEILKQACKSGRMPGVTYSKSPTGRYGGGRIAHMVSLPHADDRWFVVLDNNYIGEANYEWMTPDEFKKAQAGSRGWWVILLSPGPPPAPTNKKEG